MSSRVYLSSPDVGELEETYILQALRSGWIAPLGPDVDQFEQLTHPDVIRYFMTIHHPGSLPISDPGWGNRPAG